MKERYQELKEDIIDEQKAIEETLVRLREVRSRFDSKYKDYCTEPAMGTYLMNFYNGIENIIKRISRQYYHTMPKGRSWHKELLELAFNPPNGKTVILNQGIVDRLHLYRGFRHRFVSGYGFQLKGEKMLELTDNIESLWDDIKESVSLFLGKL